MRAIVQDSYGRPDILRIAAVPKPEPKEHEVLVRVWAASVTPADCAFRKGDPFVTRFFNGLFRPKFIPGGGFAGEIERVGEDVDLFEVGDRVFGSTGPRFGAHAEYVCLSEDGVIASMPAGMSFEEAVAVSDGALTALTFLRDTAGLQKGQSILVNGASGSVGSSAVQLAKHFGAGVTGVCSGENLDLVKSLGADDVIDYTKADFACRGETYDVVFDAVGKSSFGHCRDSLKQGGTYMTTVPSAAILLRSAWTSMFGDKRACIALAGLRQSKEMLALLVHLFQAGKIGAVMDRWYPLEEMAAAHRHVETGHKKGSVVVTIRSAPATPRM